MNFCFWPEAAKKHDRNCDLCESVHCATMYHQPQTRTRFKENDEFFVAFEPVIEITSYNVDDINTSLMRLKETMKKVEFNGRHNIVINKTK